MKSQPKDRYEELQRELDPHRAEQQKAVAEETASRLASRGILVTGKESPDELADVLSAVEQFEMLVVSHGGDLMVDDLKSSEPDDPDFRLPRRERGESLAEYVKRIDQASEKLAREPMPGD
ncbi:MAG: hypothetical protein HY700_03905 [Gemmatimonadetes bacterium]|nr:hypothetical protein [Gemmatimonadota bacterium]